MEGVFYIIVAILRPIDVEKHVASEAVLHTAKTPAMIDMARVPRAGVFGKDANS